MLLWSDCRVNFHLFLMKKWDRIEISSMFLPRMVDADENLFTFLDPTAADEPKPKRKRILRERINFSLPATQFREAFRLNGSQVESLLQIIGSDIIAVQKDGRALGPEKKLLIALHYYASSEMTYYNLGHCHGRSL